jgi:hypothetical protein
MAIKLNCQLTKNVMRHSPSLQTNIRSAGQKFPVLIESEGLLKPDNMRFLF